MASPCSSNGWTWSYNLLPSKRQLRTDQTPTTNHLIHHNTSPFRLSLFQCWSFGSTKGMALMSSIVPSMSTPLARTIQSLVRFYRLCRPCQKVPRLCWYVWIVWLTGGSSGYNNHDHENAKERQWRSCFWSPTDHHRPMPRQMFHVSPDGRFL